MKPTVKALALILTLFLGTCFLIRKTDPLEEQTEAFVRSNLLQLKHYQPIKTSPYLPVSNTSLDTFRLSLSSKKNPLIPNTRQIRRATHYFRLNDTLYSVSVYIDKKDILIKMGEPLKSSYK